MTRKEVSRGRLMTALGLNALVLPGAGHVLIGHRVLGLTIAILTLVMVFVCLFSYSTSYFEAACAMPSNMEFLPKVMKSASVALRNSSRTMEICGVFLLIFWLFGMLDLLIRFWKRKKD